MTDFLSRNLRPDVVGDDVRELHVLLARIDLSIPEAERQRGVFGPGTREAVARFQREHRLAPTGIVDAETAAALIRAADGSEYVVSGTVVSPDRAGVGGLRVRIVDKNVGPDVVLGDGVTEDRGHFEARFPAKAVSAQRKTRPDLQAIAALGDTTLGASVVRYNATTRETLDIVLAANSAVLPSEHETLTNALAAHFSGKLGDLEESDKRQDITYLANKTGWDARAVALAALAEQFSRNVPASGDGGGQRGISPAFYYALFRAGLAANANTLYAADARAVERIWHRSLATGVIPRSLEQEVPRAIRTFQSLAATRALDMRALEGTSTLSEMLRVTLGDDADRQRTFADVYTRFRDEPDRLWREVGEKLGEQTAARLRVDGQLAFLTLNNAPLVTRLRRAEGEEAFASTVDLARRGYHRAEKWSSLLADAVPSGIPGATPNEKRANYAELLATQVRLSFPTAVVGEMVRTGELPLKANDDVRDGVHRFLRDQEGKFEIGMHPIDRYVARNGLEGTVPALVTQQIKRLQRVYQITPTDGAMATLLEHDLDSAYKVVRYDEAQFVKSLGDRLGGETLARQTYAKSQLVYSTVLNVATSYLAARTAPPIGAVGGPPLVAPMAIGGSGADPAPAGGGASDNGSAVSGAEDLLIMPTLEGLFGSMDYCACKHCRSILSPAAYLVDLLQFVDSPVNEKENPQAVLFERRPDIQHLPLTCENTNTPVPYIDLVNETLEYFVANTLSLAGYTGHDTAPEATPEELLASPQFVDDAAYTMLKTAAYPPPLPFHRDLEMLRRSFGALDVSLPAAMEALRTDEAIERANAASYAWRDILIEEIGLSRDEHRLLTDRTVSLQELYGFAPAALDATVLATLANAKAFTRRAGITYAQLIDILKTRFINPSGTLIPRLERLGIPFATLKALKDGAISDAEFTALLPAGLDATPYGGDVLAWVKNEANYARIMGFITLTYPAGAPDTCSPDELELRYANPDVTANRLQAIDYIRLARFLRLWRKLGLTIEQTDKVITTLYPPPALPTGGDEAADLEQLDSGFLVLIPRIGSAFRLLKRLKLSPTKGLAGLLALWAPIDAYGDDSLYRRMFLGSALPGRDPAFADDGFGNVLANGAEMLLPHAETLRAAFALSGEEWTEIVGALAFGAATPLTLDNISAIYRRGWLARALRLSVRELCALVRLTGLDPFAPLDPANPPVERFVALAQALRASSLKPGHALYLVWNEDVSGRSAPDDADITDYARTLRADFASIASQFTVVADPTGDIARARMALVYGAEAADFFFGLLGGSLSVDVPYSHPQATLAQPVLDVAPGCLGYDDFRKRLTCVVALDAATRDALKAVAGVTAAFQAAVDALFAASESAINPFFTRYPELRPLFVAYVASMAPAAEKRTTLLASFVPALERRRQRQQALSSIAAHTRTDGALAQALLDDASVLHAAGAPTSPALEDLLGVATPGLSARFFWANTATGPVGTEVDVVASLEYAAGGSNALPANPTAGSSISGIWSGYVESRDGGFYNVAVTADPGATMTLRVGGETVTMAVNANVWRNVSAIELPAAALTEIVLTAEQVTNTLVVRWETAGRGWEVIPSRNLYSAARVERLRGVYVRYLKGASLATALRLTAAEMAFLAGHADYRIGGEGWLNALAVAGEPVGAVAASLRDVLVAMLDVARIKAAISPDEERLLQVLENPSATLPNGDSLLLTLTGWADTSLTALLARFGKARADLAHPETFRRIYDAFAIVGALGIPGAALIAATGNEPTPTIVRDLQSALRARYDAADWLAVVKPVNDAIRGRRRDALVAYVLQQLAENPATRFIDSTERLFEYFLMDVQMEPCMQTSRVRHALSSVQLFVERCLMNLEARVAPTSINPAYWEWMKRYRVWEANRKVFLWPENWLEPELRDDQSPFFKEAMAELLQSDITEDSAATALAGYLQKLEEVAKLEPCGMYYADNAPGAADDVVYVIARTPGANRKYFFRRRDHSAWTPWERIKLDIEDDPVIPVIWKGRLFVFWLRLVTSTPMDGGSQSTSSDGTINDLTLSDLKADAGARASGARVTVSAVLCWSEYVKGKWQPPKTSDVNRPTSLGSFAASGSGAFDRSKLRLGVFSSGDELRLEITGQHSSSFLLYNTHSAPVRGEDSGSMLVYLAPATRALDTTTATLTATYDRAIVQFYWVGGAVEDSSITRQILTNPIPDRVIFPRHPLADTWNAPFFYEDARHVFYVTSSERLVSIPQHGGFGVHPRGDLVTELPPLVLQRPPRKLIPDPIDPVAKLPGFGVTDPSPIERFITEDANIYRGIGTTAPVRYGSKTLGPSGALPGAITQR